MTLIEVVAALSLAASVLVLALTAYGRTERQSRISQQRIEAVRIADDLLATWFSHGNVPPMPKRGQQPVTGTIHQENDWTWQVSAIDANAPPRPSAKNPLRVLTYRLQVFPGANIVPNGDGSLVTIEFAGEIVGAHEIAEGEP